MVFSSISFILYFLPVFLLGYWLSPQKFKNWVILLASIFFYSWGAPKFVFVLLGSTVLDFYIVRSMDRSEGRRRKQLLALSLIMNLGLLIVFKYANFFVENVNVLGQKMGMEAIQWTKIALPIGISFYTFQTLTYAVDVYRKVHEPLVKLKDYLLYIMSFPQMIAGPIVRFSHVADQITNRKETMDDKLFGFYRFSIGLAKKVLIANTLGQTADFIMGLPADGITFWLSWIGIISYTFQIYFDFAGYSDMAIGLGKMMGFSFPENFDNPYNSRSITEFWRRWHMTLGQWMRDYLYIPLGGNKVGKVRMYVNLWLVFLISGLWHGASWNFIIWGAFHGLFLILDRLFLKQVLDKIGVIPSVLFTFLVVVIGWVFFRLETLDEAIHYLQVMFGVTGHTGVFNMNTELLVFTVIAAVISFVCLTKPGQALQGMIYQSENCSIRRYILYTGTAIILLGLSISTIAAQGFNPFIYYRF